MLSHLSLVVTLTLALAVAANPLVIRRPLLTLPMVKRINATGSTNVLRRDQARARQLKHSGAAKSGVKGLDLVSDAVVSIPATEQIAEYVVTVSIMLSAAIQMALIWLYVGRCWHTPYSM